MIINKNIKKVLIISMLIPFIYIIYIWSFYSAGFVWGVFSAITSGYFNPAGLPKTILPIIGIVLSGYLIYLGTRKFWNYYKEGIN